MLDGLSVATVLNASPNAVFLKDESLRFIFINKAYETIFGVKEEDLLGKSVFDMTHLPEADRAFYHNEDTKVLRRGQMRHHIFDYRFKDGKKHRCLYWSNAFVQENGQRGIIGVIVNITQQSKTILSLQRQLQQAVLEKKKVEEKSALDGLTNVYTRRVFDGLLTQYSQDAAQNGASLSCIMLDIDFFKKVNDTFGHQVGDDVLRQLGGILKACLRDNDVVCRYGGEEFVLLLPGGNLNKAAMVAERVRLSASQWIRLPDASTLTISAGCSEYIHGEDEALFLKRADDALYAAKETGRNRVCLEAGGQKAPPPLAG